MKVSVLLLALTFSCGQTLAANLRTRNILEMSMAEEDEAFVEATPVAPVESSSQAVLAESEPVQLVAPVPAAVVPAPIAVLAESEPMISPVPAIVSAPVAVLAESEPVQFVAPVPAAAVPAPVTVLAESEPIAAPVPVAVPAPIAVPAASSVAVPKSQIVSSVSSNTMWASTFSKHTTDEALLAMFDVAAQLKSAYSNFDINGDGTVDENEVSEIINPTSIASLRRLGMELAGDEVADQVVATAELPSPVEAAEAKSQTVSNKLNALFDLVEKMTIAHGFFDADSDGVVSADDLVQIAKGASSTP